jgi:hypothetical protein
LNELGHCKGIDCEPLNLKLLTDFVNKIGSSPPFTIFVALTRQIVEGIDQYYRTNDYAFGVKKPRRMQIRQRPNSSSARGIVPACPARCLRWSPNVQMPAPSGTRIGVVSSAVRGVEVLFPLLTASLRSTSLPSLRNVRTELARVLLTSACSLGRLCCGLLALLTRNGK